MTPDLTVIIATRDRPALLRAAIAAVEAQRYSGVIETVVVFDQSEVDHTVERAGGHRPVRATFNGRTPGLPGARNTGAAAASAPVLAFCDDDDEWLPTKATQQLALLASKPQIDVVATGVAIEYGDRAVNRVPPPEITFDDLLRRRMMEAHPSSVMVRREAFFDRIGLVDEEIPGGYAEDYEWLLRAARDRPVGAVPHPLVRVRWGQGSYFVGRWQEIDRALAYLLAKYPEFGQHPRGLARVLGQRAFASAAVGQREQAWRLIRRTLEAHWREPRAYLSVLVAAGLIRPDQVLRVLHRLGRGI